ARTRKRLRDCSGFSSRCGKQTAVAIFFARFTVQLLPVHQFDRRRNQPSEVGADARLLPLAAAVLSLNRPGSEVLRLAALRFHGQLGEAAANQHAAETLIVVVQLNAHHALADAGQDIYLVDGEVDEVAAP